VSRIWSAGPGLIAVLAVCLLLWAGPAAAQSASNGAAGAADAGENESPINITSDHMEADDKKKVIVFTGNVVARQKEMIVHCDVMTVYYREVEAPPEAEGSSGGAAESPAGEAAPADPEAAADAEENPDAAPEGNTRTEVVRIIAEGNVKITQEDRVALANKAVYEAQAVPRSVVLTGEPRVWRKKDFLTGRRITFYLDDGRSVVEGGEEERVNAVFYQGSGGSTDFAAPGSEDDQQ
jgi:lipopolysaccharide export system protein LptA